MLGIQLWLPYMAGGCSADLDGAEFLNRYRLLSRDPPGSDGKLKSKATQPAFQIQMAVL